MLKKFRLEDSKPMKTPMSTETKLKKDEEGESIDNTKYRGMIGFLLYLTASRLDIMFSVCLCARFQKDPKTSHLEAVKRIFRYVKGTTHLGLWYPKGSGIETIVYADSDHAGDYVDRKSTSGICTFMGCCLTSWFSKKQTALAISTTEAEYVSAGKACQQALWMKQALVDYGIRLDDIPIMCDNKGAIDLSKNPVQHSRTKHIEIRHHFLRDNVQKGNISIEKVKCSEVVKRSEVVNCCEVVWCLLLVCRDDTGSREFTIYEMMKGCSVWSVRCLLLVCRDDTGSRDFTIYEMMKGCSVWSVRKGRGFFFSDKLIRKGYKIQPNIKGYQWDICVGIKSLLKVTAVKLVLLVQKLQLLVLKLNAARHNLQLLVNVNVVEDSGFSECKFDKVCIEQFWSTAKAKTVNEEVQLQALVDGKNIVVTKASVRRDLQLEDAEGVDCLPNATFLNSLHSWVFFESMMKNLDSAVKFLMYPRFVQVLLDNQLEGMINHNRIYIEPSHTKKVFANMKRQGKDFSSRVIPLFSTMMVQAQQEQGEGSDMPTITQPSSSQPQKKHKPRNPKKKDTQIPQSNVPSDNLSDEAVNEENISKHSNDLLLSGEDRLKLEELMALYTNLQNRVLDLEHKKTTHALEIDSLKRRVKKLEKKQRSRTHRLRRLYKVGLSVRVVSSEDEGLGEEDASKQGRKIHDIDDDKDITLENVHDEDITADPVTTAGEVVTTANVKVSTASLIAATVTTVKLTLAQTLAELKSARPKTKGVVMQEPSETTATTKIPSKDKGKGTMVEEPLKMKKKDQVLFDEQEAIRLQAQFNEEESIAREKEEDNAALIAQWNDI
ncbi:hypothetical protein Tco_0975650 [Tanacetum coccineum]|uniref:Copia protein n=1 Tax=Tanacetum coccineum TaxID=301880 RepID=A0ABQ5EFA2_9ASTR